MKEKILKIYNKYVSLEWFSREPLIIGQKDINDALEAAYKAGQEESKKPKEVSDYQFWYGG